jgi:peptidylprolyl isomerase
LSKELSNFEELMVPKDFKRSIPEEYKSLPALQGRAEIEMTMKKPDGSQYDVDGKLYDSVTVKMVIDGYNAPLTGGNIVDLVSKGFYNGMKVMEN